MVMPGMPISAMGPCVTFAVLASALIELTVPITFIGGYDPFLLSVENTHLDGTMDDAVVDGAIYGAIPVDVILNEIVDPLIPKEGYNIDLDPDLETKEEIMVIVEELAILVADVELGKDRKGISAAFSFNSASCRR